MNYNTLNIDELMDELRFSEPVENAVRKKLKDPKIENCASTAYKGDGFDFAICRRMPLTRLTVVCRLLLQKYGEYIARGVSKQIIFDTFRDVSLRAQLYFEKTGKAGITKDDAIWFRHIINIKIFKIGALQFQPFEMVYLDEETIGEKYMVFSQKQKETLPAGTPVINCHVQKRANLDPALVNQSFDDARAFFLKIFPKKRFKAFLCYSWLLYPAMTEKLGKNSKIKRFSENFTIVSSCDDHSEAVKNLFAEKNAKKLLAMTYLQKLAANHIEYFGYACGIKII